MRSIVMLLSVISILVLLPSIGRSACNVCHSKKPEMRRMHEAQGYKDCFTCHGPAAKPFDRQKRQNDPRCQPCHATQNNP